MFRGAAGVRASLDYAHHPRPAYASTSPPHRTSALAMTENTSRPFASNGPSTSQSSAPAPTEPVAQAAPSEQDPRASIWNERWGFMYRLRVSALYHQRRERFFDNWDKVAKAVAVIGGAAAVSQLISDPTTKLWAAAAVSVLSTISLVFGFSQKARRHSELARDFMRLLARIEEAGPYPPAEKMDKFAAEFASLEASEPASMSALVRHCENLFYMSSGQPGKPLTWWKRLFMHYWDFALDTEQNPSSRTATVMFWIVVTAILAGVLGWFAHARIPACLASGFNASTWSCVFW